MDEQQPLELIKRITALSDTGLVYADDEYHRERYEELREISLQLLSIVSGRPLKLLQDFYSGEFNYDLAAKKVTSNEGVFLNFGDEYWFELGKSYKNQPKRIKSWLE